MMKKKLRENDRAKSLARSRSRPWKNPAGGGARASRPARSAAAAASSSAAAAASLLVLSSYRLLRSTSSTKRTLSNLLIGATVYMYVCVPSLVELVE